MIMVYLTCGLGISSANLVKLTGPRGFLKLVVGPWVALGDWKSPSSELASSHWFTEVQGVLAATSTSWTQQAGRVLDFAVLSHSAATKLSDHRAGTCVCGEVAFSYSTVAQFRL